MIVAATEVAITSSAGIPVSGSGVGVRGGKYLQASVARINMVRLSRSAFLDVIWSSKLSEGFV